MYSLGVPAGLLVDMKGPRPAVIVGALLLGIGYFPFRASYDNASGSVAMLCFFSFLTGLGGCTAFAGAVKTSALNWPNHRGTATAFPLAAFGLSAFFFSFLGSVFFSGDTGAFLMLLAAGTFGVTFVGFFFIQVVPHTSYHAVPNHPGLRGAQQLRRTPSEEAKIRNGLPVPDIEPGMSPTKYTNPTTSEARGQVARAGSPSSQAASAAPVDVEAAPPPSATDDPDQTDETSSLMSKGSSLPGDVLVQSSVDMDRSHRVDIRGWHLLRSLDFWLLFSIMGILAGIGLMTIKYDLLPRQRL